MIEEKNPFLVLWLAIIKLLSSRSSSGFFCSLGIILHKIVKTTHPPHGQLLTLVRRSGKLVHFMNYYSLLSFYYASFYPSDCQAEDIHLFNSQSSSGFEGFEPILDNEWWAYSNKV